MPIIKQFRTTRRTIREDVREAMRLEGLPKRMLSRLGFNGAMPGDGICWGSVTYPANAYGGQHCLFRVYNVDDIRGRINDREERAKLARDIRSYAALLARRLHPVSRLMSADGLSAFDSGYSDDGQGVKRWRIYLAGGSQELVVFERPKDVGTRYMIRVNNCSGEHINTLFAPTFVNLRAKLAGLGVPRAAAYYQQARKAA